MWKRKHDIRNDANYLDPEVQQLKVNQGDLSQLNTTNKENMVSAINGNGAHLTKIAEANFKESLLNHKNRKPMILWTDDDGHMGVYTKIFPLLKELNVKMSSAIITDRAHGFPIDGLPPYNPNGLYFSYEQAKEMEKSGLVEFIAHSHTHNINYRLTDMTIEEMHVELKTNRDIMQKLGWNYRHFVYPFGSENPTVHSVVRQYFKSAFDVGGGVLTTPLNQFKIPRVPADSRSFEQIKVSIDEALEKNTLAVLTTHVDQSGGLDMDIMREVILYAKSKGIEFVTTEEAINEFGNFLQMNDESISHDGETHGKTLGIYRNGHLDFTPNAPITEFKKGTVTRLKVRIMDMEGYMMPDEIRNMGGYGFIEVYRDSTEDSFSFQKFTNSVTAKKYIRRWMHTTNEWGVWSLTEDENVYLNRHLDFTPNAPITEFKKGTVTRLKVRSSEMAGYRLTNDLRVASGSYGFIEVYRDSTEDMFSFQQFIDVRSRRTYIRRWLHDTNEWGVWEDLDGTFYVKKSSLNDPPSEYRQLRSTIEKVTNANASAYGLPSNSGGLIITERDTESSYSYQTYIPIVAAASSNSRKVRYATSDNSGWGSWTSLPSSPSNYVRSLTNITIPANSSHDVSSTFSTASPDDFYIESIKTALPAGINVKAYCWTSGTLIIRITNSTTSSVVLNTLEVTVRRLVF